MRQLAGIHGISLSGLVEKAEIVKVLIASIRKEEIEQFEAELARPETKSLNFRC